MLVTYLKRHGASDEVMKSMGNAMHQSTKMQNEVYDHRNSIEKVAPAQELVLRLAMGEPMVNLVSGRSLTVEELVQQIGQLTLGDRQSLLTMLNTPYPKS